MTTSAEETKQGSLTSQKCYLTNLLALLHRPTVLSLTSIGKGRTSHHTSYHHKLLPISCPLMQTNKQKISTNFYGCASTNSKSIVKNTIKYNMTFLKTLCSHLDCLMCNTHSHSPSQLNDCFPLEATARTKITEHKHL